MTDKTSAPEKFRRIYRALERAGKKLDKTFEVRLEDLDHHLVLIAADIIEAMDIAETARHARAKEPDHE